MTPSDKLAHHLTLRPELPRPYDPTSEAAADHQAAFQTWVDAKDDLEAEVRRESTRKLVFHRMDPVQRWQERSCTPRSDYHYREPIKRRRKAS